MSARKPMARPLTVLWPRMTPTTPVLPTPAWNSTPSAASSLRHDFRGAMFLEAELRVCVQIAPHRGELGVLRAKKFDGAHGN